MVRWITLFWGVSVFFPIGLNYAAFLALLLGLLVQGRWRERWERLRREPNWWPSLLLLAWAALVLLVGARYPETPSNALHLLRVILMLWMVLMLTAEEAAWAVRGFCMGLIASLVLMGLNRLVGLPASTVWESLLYYSGNKSIANAILLALSAVSGLLLAPWLRGKGRVAAVLVSLGALCALIWMLPSRTALLIVLVTAAAGVLHQFRARYRHQLMLMVAMGGLVVATGLLAPQVKERLVLGVSEITRAHQGQVVGHASSWGIRYRMYETTLDMIEERPWMGWGVGAWNQQWRQRIDPALADYNMPHNDFLWIGSQTGVPGVLLLLLTVAAGLPRAWRRRDLSGRLGVVALLTMLMALAVNSALRDAAIGLTLWFAVLVWQRLSTEPPERWLQALQPQHHEAV